ncbi:MAG: hypothetical protein WKF55_07930 [Gemmatimonadaceae bacterium]
MIRNFSPTRLPPRLLLGATALALVAVGTTLRAQEVRFSTVQGWSGHDLVGDPRGVGATVGFPLGRLIVLRVGYERLRSSRHRTAETCFGLRDPADCPPEPVREEARLGGAAIALSATLASGRHVALSVVPRLGLANANVTTRGLASGRTLSGDQLFVAADVGLAMAIAPSASSPLALHLGASAGTLSPRRELMQVVDGYTAFTGGFGLSRVEAGLTWRARRHSRPTRVRPPLPSRRRSSRDAGRASRDGRAG